MFSFLSKVEFSRHGTTDGHWISSQKEVIFPCFGIGKLNPRADRAEIVLDHSQTLAVANNVVMSGHEVKAHVILLATIDGQTGHHHTIASALSANIDRLTVSGLVRIVSLVNMRFTDRDIGVNVGCVHPFAAEVLGQRAPGLHKFSFYGRQLETFGRSFRSLQRITFGSNGHTHIEIVITILEEAAVLLILTRLLSIGHGKVVVLAHKPIAQATELHGAGERSLHALALLVGDVELLVLDEELGAGRLAGLNAGVGLVAHASEAESILKAEDFWNIVGYFKVLK